MNALVVIRSLLGLVRFATLVIKHVQLVMVLQYKSATHALLPNSIGITIW